MRRASAFAFGFALLTAAPLSAQTNAWYELQAGRQIVGVRSMEADIEYAVGRLHVTSTPQGMLSDITLRYDSREFEPTRSWSVDGGTGRLGLGLASRIRKA